MFIKYYMKGLFGNKILDISNIKSGFLPDIGEILTYNDKELEVVEIYKTISSINVVLKRKR